ncbi:hypothetical protein Tsubulata_044201 [Turnera subulata]|uniref:LOB domain-containing protein n=1 Tax=Turnera subulata TaxID=218843 RepID=A0A9Q0F6A9_9ROSI|nr:hypothetical protein Tsubulata_044201 [Turnera subulata]
MCSLQIFEKKCPQDCVLAPYFPPTNTQRFADVHKIFGASNILQLKRELPEYLRAAAAECMSIEATARVRDPVCGSARLISQLQQQINQIHSELPKTNGAIALYNAHHHHQQQQQLQVQNVVVNTNEEEYEEKLLWWLMSSMSTRSHQL